MTLKIRKIDQGQIFLLGISYVSITYLYNLKGLLCYDLDYIFF